MPRTMRTGRGTETVERGTPLRCPNGHRLRPPNVRIGWLPCTCVPGMGHRTYRCETCRDVVHDPPHVDPTRELAYRPR